MATYGLIHGAWHRGELMEHVALPWHPRLSDKLGLCRSVWMPGSHQVNFTAEGLGEKNFIAGRG